MKLFIHAACAAAALLSGCQTGTTTNRVPAEPVTATPPAQRIALQQQRLWMEGDLLPATPLPVSTIRSNSDRITLSWDGDALELLRDLARARGQTFSYAGVKLPMPVNIDVQAVTYENLLRIIEMQTAWRATLRQYPGQMVLEFMSAIPARKGGRR